MRWAGGWLFDLVMAGWEAIVLTTEETDPRPLRILGARPLDLETDLATSLRPPGPQTLAVDARLCESNERVRRLMLSTLDGGTVEVRLWGDRWPAGFDDATGSPRQHRLSVAAQAFKAQAMTAAVAGTSTDTATEVFRGVRHRTRTALASIS